MAVCRSETSSADVREEEILFRRVTIDCHVYSAIKDVGPIQNFFFY